MTEGNRTQLTSDFLEGRRQEGRAAVGGLVGRLGSLVPGRGEEGPDVAGSGGHLGRDVVGGILGVVSVTAGFVVDGQVVNGAHVAVGTAAKE